MAAGADAIYLGGNMFGARAFANNFNDEELIGAIEYAHLFGRKVYLTVNTLLKSREIENSLIEYLIPFYEAGLDAVIVQDMGVLKLIRKHFPDMDIHASTQMTQTGVYGSRLLKELGASRIVTSREMNLQEIKQLHDELDVEIESFVTVIQDNACFQVLTVDEAATGEDVPSHAECLMMCMIAEQRLMTKTTVMH